LANILSVEQNANNICKTIITGGEQNLNKQMAEFGISILCQYFMFILAKFNTFSRSWKPISQFNTFNAAWEPCTEHGKQDALLFGRRDQNGEGATEHRWASSETSSDDSRKRAG